MTEFEEFEQAVGERIAKRVRAFYGDGSLYVPRELAPRHGLVYNLGRRDAEAVVAAWGGTRLEYVPPMRKQQRNEWIAEHLDNGASVRDVAEMFGVSRRLVMDIRRRRSES